MDPLSIGVAEPAPAARTGTLCPAAEPKSSSSGAGQAADHLVGQNAGYGWFEPGFHGTKDERYAAFVLGYQATEIRAYDAYATYMLDRTVSDGPYAIGYLEGASATFTTEEAYEITGSPYGDVRFVGDAVTVTSQDYDGSLTEALASYAPDATGDLTALSVLGETHDYTETVQSWGIPGMTVGFFYSYNGPGDPRHGYVTVHLSPTEHSSSWIRACRDRESLSRTPRSWRLPRSRSCPSRPLDCDPRPVGGRSSPRVGCRRYRRSFCRRRVGDALVSQQVV